MAAGAGETSGVTWVVSDGLATIRIERQHGNAIDGGVVSGLEAAFVTAAEDPSVRGVLLTSGGSLFCPGLDLRDLAPIGRAEMTCFLDAFSGCLLRMYEFPKPVVAALSGHALAGGCILSLTADWRILRRGALIGLNEIRVGLPLPFGAAHLLRASVHPNRLEEVALLGRNYADEEAVETGLVHEIRESQGFEGGCRARLEEFAGKDLGAFALTKSYLRSATVERIRDGDHRRRDEFLDFWFSEATQHRIRRIASELRTGSR